MYLRSLRNPAHLVQRLTRTTRMSALWEYPYRAMITHTIDSYYQIPSQSYKFEKFAKNSNLGILQKTLHTTHLFKLLNKV